MEFRVLGPVQMLSDGNLLPIRERKQRLVLASLLLEANQLVSLDRLIDVLWVNDPPPSARRVLQAHLSRLRTTFEGLDGKRTRLTRYGACYMLECDTDQVDVLRFRALLDEARTAPRDEAKAAILQEALALWRGPALADAADERLRRELCGGLDEARMAAIEDRVDSQLRLGQHAALVDELTGLYSRHPTRTRVVAQLMTALHRCGRSCDALEVYRRTRKYMHSELGVDPAAGLDRLYTAILHGDASLEPLLPAGAPSEPASAVVTATELSKLVCLLEETRRALAKLTQQLGPAGAPLSEIP